MSTHRRSHIRRGPSIGVAAALIALLTTSCAAGDDSPPAATDPQIPTFTASGPGGEAAALSGVLERSGTCPRIAGHVLVFPSNAKARWEGNVLRFAGKSLTVGQNVTVGGAGVQDTASLPENVAASAECRGKNYWYVNADA